MIDYRLFMMIYKPSKLIYSSVHIDRVYQFKRDHFSRIQLYTYISFNGPRVPPVFHTLAIGHISKYTCAPLSKLLSCAPACYPGHNRVVREGEGGGRL